MVYLVGLFGVFGLGMCFSLLGTISVKLMPRLKIDQGKFGSLVSAFMFCCLVASLIVGVLMDQLGYQAVAIFGFVAAAVCILIFARAKSFGAAVLACLLLGFAAMALNTVGNVLGTTVFKRLFDGDAAAANNLLNVFFGLGLFVTPFLVSFLFQKTTYEKAISVLAVIILIPAIFAVFATYPKAGAFKLADAFALLKEPACIMAALVLFCYIALESSFCNWLAPYGKELLSKGQELGEEGEKKVDASAQRLLSVFAIFMMIGRLVTSLSGLASFGTWTIAGAAVAATLIILAMMTTAKPGAAFVLAALSGLAFAPCFPTTVGVVFGKYGGESGSLFGIIFAVGLLGAVIVPKAMGNLSKGSSVQKSLKLLLPVSGLLVILAIVFGKVDFSVEAKAKAKAAQEKQKTEQVEKDKGGSTTKKTTTTNPAGTTSPAGTTLPAGTTTPPATTP